MGRRKKSTKSNETWKKDKVKDSSADSSTMETLVPENVEKITKNSTTTKLLDIYARLALPYSKLNEANLWMNDSDDDDDDDETLEFDIRPRFIFSFNACLVCMKTSDSKFTCERCKMTSYCTLEHLKENRTSHSNLCNVLSKEFGGIEAFRCAQDTTADVYRSLRIKMIDLIEKKINRRLDLWEREIILYPRVCRICRKIGNDLARCTRCKMDFYCKDHADNHKIWCKDFQVFRRIILIQHRHGYASPNFPNIRRKKCFPLAKNFDTLLLEMYEDNVDNYRLIDAHTYASMSLLATAPLTALFALQKTCKDWTSKEILRVDIVGAEFQFECASLRVWEKLFLHYLPKLKKLYLVFVGPELHLPDAPLELLSRVKLCKRCKNEKRRINVNFNDAKLYHEILENLDYPADLVCLFNPGLYRDTGYDNTDTWPKTIEKFCRAKVPVVVTSYTEIEIPKDIRRIQSIGKIEIMLEPQKNPFASVKPDRNFVSDDIAPLMYKNYCLSVVKGV